MTTKMQPTPEERRAFLLMQGRLVELLLRHEAPRFNRIFGERIADAANTEDERLRHYRELAVLFHLRDELFDSILPRIKRRLSFESPREVLIEELPPRGRIDWNRTVTAAWRNFPGEVPLEVHTRQRRRHFATPENLLTVVTLLEYRAAVERLLAEEASRDAVQAIRHPLQDIVHACTRELVFPQFAGLVHECQEIISGQASKSVADLEHAVEEHLLPGRNSAYDDLLGWRRQLATLQLLEAVDETKSEPTLGADPKRDNYLYQLWILYELVDMLQLQGRLVEWNYREMWLIFTWGEGNQQRKYCLQHDRKVLGLDLWVDAPGVRPDFYVFRTDRREIGDEDRLIWREPGYVLDAKYYKPRDSVKAPSSPVKRMIADLQLIGERYGALLFAFQGSPEDVLTPQDDAELEPDLDQRAAEQNALYRVSPVRTTAQVVHPDLCIDIWRVRPEPGEDGRKVHATLTALLEIVDQTLKDEVEVRCRGVFIDQLTATAHGEMLSATGFRHPDGLPVTGPVDDLLLCPKPHVAPWRVDVVSLTRDCCKNSLVCHVKGMPGVTPPRRLLALDDIAEAIRVVGDERDEEALTQAATRQVLAITRRYAGLLQPNIATYRRWIRDRLDIGEYFDNTPLLTEAQRETLALGRFLWEQIENIQATNFAGPVLLFTGVLEELTRATVYKYSPRLCSTDGRALPDTLGTLGNSKRYGGTNWAILEQAIVHGGHWKQGVTPNLTLTFSKWIDMIKEISFIRNGAAHRANVEPKSFQTFVSMYFGSPLSGIGVFNGLLLAWEPGSPES